MFYSEVMNSENTGKMVEHFHDMIDSIIQDGVGIPISSQQMKRRKQLGLPPIEFDTEEIKKITKRITKEEGE